MSAVRATAIPSEHNSRPQESRPERESAETKNGGCKREIDETRTLTGGCEVPESAESKNGGVEPVKPGREIDETRGLTGGGEVAKANNKRVEEARRARVEGLQRLRRECGSEEEFQTARSKPLLTQLDSTSCSSSSCAPCCLSPSDLECIRHENRLHFHRLMDTELSTYTNTSASIREPGLTQSDFSRFYVDCGDRLEAGKNIGGGAQAEIHEAIYDGKVLDWCVLKVSGSGYLLADLQRMWISNI